MGHFDKKEAPGWPVLDSVESLVEIVTIVVWTASCHHAAVNFGQYEYAAFMPNHPTATRRPVPLEGTPEFQELERDPEAFYLSMVSNETQATVIATTTEGLSSHSTHEEYLGQRSTPNWTSDDKVGVLTRISCRSRSRILKICTVFFSGCLKYMDRGVDTLPMHPDSMGHICESMMGYLNVMILEYDGRKNHVLMLNLYKNQMTDNKKMSKQLL